MARGNPKKTSHKGAHKSPPKPSPKKPTKSASQRQHRTFCSARCATIDLGRWLKGTYAVPTQERPDDEDRES